MNKRLFDYYISVDWSAKASPSPKKPSPDAIWVGERDSAGTSKEQYFRTRYACREYLLLRLGNLSAEKKRIWIGFDFAYGYPKGFASELGLPGKSPWLETWKFLSENLEDNAENQNNRFVLANKMNSSIGGSEPGPFFGRPNGRTYENLELTSPKLGSPYPGKNWNLERLRICDKRLSGIQSVWKLIGPGCVGSQSLVGIPVLHYLICAKNLKSISEVWPFTTGFKKPILKEGFPAIIHTEIWPSLVNDLLDPKIDVKDKAQVRALSKRICDLDSKGLLAKFFIPPKGLSKEEITIAQSEEGWILGTTESKTSKKLT